MPKRAHAGRPPKFNSAAELGAKIEEYFKSCEGEPLCGADGVPLLDKRNGHPLFNGRKPPTVSGLAYFLGFTSRAALLYWQGKPEYAPIIERAKLKIEGYNEERLYDRDGVRGAMFNLSNNYSGWSSEPRRGEDEEALAKLDELIEGITHAAER